MAPPAIIFDRPDDQPRFHDIPVVEETLVLAGRTFRLACLRDAADLLDDPEFAKKFVEEDKAPYGMELWPAAPMLAEFILTGEEGQGRSALDLGCGLGLVAMAAAIRGWDVMATDYDDDALRFCRHNAALNGVTIPHYQALDWTQPPAGTRYEQVLGSDVLYQRNLHQPILGCIQALLAEGGTALLADPNRSVADGFAELARKHGFEVEVLPVAALFRTRGRIEGRIFRLRRG